jgi:hypothetical protein
MDDLIEFHVGDVLPDTILGRVVGTATFEHMAAMNTLLVVLDGVTKMEINAVSKGVVHVGAVKFKSVVFFVYMFGFSISPSITKVVLEGDCPFNINLVPPEARSIPPASIDEAMAHLQIILVEKKGGTIKAVRNVLLAGTFTNYLYGLIRNQANEPFDKETHVKDVNEGHETFPGISSMFSASSIVAKIDGN